MSFSSVSQSMSHRVRYPEPYRIRPVRSHRPSLCFSGQETGSVSRGEHRLKLGIACLVTGLLSVLGMAKLGEWDMRNQKLFLENDHYFRLQREVSMGLLDDAEALRMRQSSVQDIRGLEKDSDKAKLILKVLEDPDSIVRSRGAAMIACIQDADLRDRLASVVEAKLAAREKPDLHEQAQRLTKTLETELYKWPRSPWDKD